MRKFGPVAVLVSALCVLAPHAVLAQTPPGSEHKDPIGLYVQAGADGEQQQKIRQLAGEFESTARVKIERASNLMRKMQQFSMEPSPEPKTVIATQDEINKLNSDVASSRIKLMLNIRAVLTEQQRQNLVQLLKDRKAMHGQGM